MEDSTKRAVNRAISTMRENLGEPLTVDDMARAAMFSKFHFTRIFQRATGISPGRFLSALRLQRAKQLLISTSLNVADISLRVGYNSVGTFSSRFTRSVGMSPTTYRRRAGYAPHIATDAGPAPLSEARVHGRIPTQPGQPNGQVFVGLFTDRIPEGRPVRCGVLPHGGYFHFGTVPPGTWYLLAQAVDTDAGGRPDEANRPIAVASEGPLTVTWNSDIQVDLDLQPIQSSDPPVLLALMDSRKLALARVAAQQQAVETPLSSAPVMITKLRESDRTAA
ncbi:helix-turn-helix domain-containing protein [Micromonospora profundi]|uniref:AraC family transcriptional regulator n=1 Tax=Micromonospora profundi TaxID=1420889 RepID=A0AAJ6I121_9ACTN|nr:AraC family transcriptional regulator [Micromonospora profundi]WLS48804.1 AraC family transcriptional regulator [Micromonospora profundi]